MFLSSRQVFIALFIIGFALCSRGIVKISADDNWVSPFAVAGYLLGLLAIVLFISILTGHKFLFISDDKQATVVLGAIIILKFIIGFMYSSLKIK